MSKKLLIDAVYPEEMRVAIVSDGILESFDSEIISKKSCKGNIYLGRVMRIEPALQAAFIDYGAEKQGFLPLSEIHPHYYQAVNSDLNIVEESDNKPDRKQCRIQDVIQRRQTFPVQILKDPRHNKGAFLTTYIAISGRYCILMPNSGHRTGGVSRRIDSQDRKRLKQILGDLRLPEGMSLILRTAVQDRTKLEIKRDLDYLMRVWRDIYNYSRTQEALSLLYLEANLIHRALRDLYARDMDEILIEGQEAYKNARVFMKKLVASHVTRIHLYKNKDIPIFRHFEIEDQIESIFQPSVPLPSGGSVVIHVTEALVAIDVNSGKSTKEKNLDETALSTNIQAADEIARQVRLRDLSGIIVIDFIDMSNPLYIQQVETRFKAALKPDRARIQLGKIGEFGLLEFSRQRIRPSIIDYHSHVCPQCNGTGRVRVTESTALLILRAIENKLQEGNIIQNLTVYVPEGIDNFLLNDKRAILFSFEQRFSCIIHIVRKNSIKNNHFEITCDV